jgi:hypothetical protein
VFINIDGVTTNFNLKTFTKLESEVKLAKRVTVLSTETI